MRTILLTMPILTGLLAACGDAGDPPQSRAPEPPSAIQNTVAALPDNQRDAMLIRAIRDAGLDCQGVTGARRVDTAPGRPGGDPSYVAECIGGASYGVSIGRDGTAQVAAAPPR